MRKCPDCSQTGFESKLSLRCHRRQTHGFVVCTCRRTFLKNEYMMQHRAMNRIHLQGYYSSSSSLVNLFQGLSVTTGNDLYSLQRGDIDTFIAENIQSDSQFLGCCGEVIDILVRKLHQIDKFAAKLEPSKIIKSGSLGKGTAVKERADIDLVMMLNGYRDVEQLMGDMGRRLPELEDYLLNHTQARKPKRTRYSVQVEITCSSGHTHDVDILPAVDLLGLGKSPLEIFQKMKSATKANIHEYSVSLAPLQLDIIKPLPAKVKSLIKVLKYWRDKKLKERNEPEMSSFAERNIYRPNWPSSYALELVVINSWNEAGNPESFDMAKALHTVLTSLVNHGCLMVMLNKQMKYSMDMAQICKTPYIMDPANPFNDMYHGLVGGEAFDWEKVVPEAQRWRSKPLFYGINASKAW